ncbi:Sodium/calcium exchanger protein-domain-containing protein [Lipomyces kononenkoae]|uniref:Sodium/calcium exchanger protein-domain-containing protein n=1 Tax=Lipomyces kononenkoae TaxID=34357 RepID=A0ACC3T096_LIPKO
MSVSVVPWQVRYLALPSILLILALSSFVHAEYSFLDLSNETLLPFSPILKMQKTPYELLSLKTAEDGLQCSHVLKVTDKCAFVKQYCAGDQLGLFNYLELYYCTLADAKPIAIAIIALWLIAVFTTIGITASDFLCPNLNTISDLLGMSESLAGVTFLALGNGSPDVFSTYAAMKAGSGSLAVGELIGAASFITSVVAGSVAIICPFTVDLDSFLRELGFFTAAVAFAMFCLQDGSIALWECTAMVIFYLVYVVFVVSWHWWFERGPRSRSSLTQRADHSETTPATRSSDQQLSYYSDVENGRSLHEHEDVTAPLLGASRSASSVDIAQAVDPYHLRTLQDGTYEEIAQTMRLHRPWNSVSIAYGHGESSNLGSSVPVRPSLMGALELRSAVHRGRKAMKLDEEAMSRHFRNRSLSQAFSRRHKALHAHRLSVDPAILAGASSRYAYGQENVRGHKFRSHSEIMPREVAYFSDGSRPSSRGSSRSPQRFASTFPRQFASTTYHPDELRAAPLMSPPMQPPRSPSLSLYAPPNVSYPSRQSSVSAVPSIVGPRSRSNSSQTERGTSPYGRSRRSKLTHTRNTSSTRTRSRSTSPFDRFLAFQPPSRLSVSSEIPQGVSQITDEHLMPSDGRTIRYSNGPPSPGMDMHLDVSHVNESMSNISEVDPQISDDSLQGRGWFRVPSAYDLKKALFPTIDRLHEKTHLNKFISVIAVPSVLLLTVTVPVIEAERLEAEDLDDDSFNIPEVQVEGDGSAGYNGSPVEADENISVMGRTIFKGWNKWLTCVQCLLSPVGILYMNWYADDSLLRNTVYVCLGSLIALVALLMFTESRKPPVKLLPVLCFVGFIVSISWISTIAVEAVSIMKAFGIIFGISDAIIGLTVFALGNSLGDFVSNITVAKMGYQKMAISACFGSPMLNILIGIGVSGIIILPSASDYTNEDAYRLEIAPSLIISAATLFLNLLLFLTCVPLNKWRMTRAIGFASVTLWIVGTCINVVLEIMTRSQ